MIESLFDYLNPETLIQQGGLVLLFAIVFAETGLFFGFFLPGDSLLFIAGLLCDSPYLDTNPALLIILLVIGATLGTIVGYLTGRWTETYLRNRKENFFYKKKYLEVAQTFYNKHGMVAFITGRFLPVVRTFVPIVAGIIRIPFSKFLVYNFIGATLWVSILVIAGYLLGNRFPLLIDHIELIIVFLIVITSIPVIITFLKQKKSIKKEVEL